MATVTICDRCGKTIVNDTGFQFNCEFKPRGLYSMEEEIEKDFCESCWKYISTILTEKLPSEAILR